MELWQREIAEIIEDAEACELFDRLSQQFQDMDITEEARRLVSIILRHVSEELPVPDAFFMAFWLGVAWGRMVKG